MNILCLNPPFKEEYGRFSREQRSPAITKSGTLYYPFWLCYAVGVLDEAGFNVKLVDAPAEGTSRETMKDFVVEFQPEIIVIDTSTPSICNDIEIADLLGELMPKSFIVLVGTHPSALPKETLNLSSRVNAIAVGEYDYTLRELANTLVDSGDVKNVSGLYLKNGDECQFTGERELIADLDKLPMLAKVYEKYLDMRNYSFAASRFPMVMMITSRGCPHQCIYCVYPQVMHRKKYRCQSAERVVKEMLYIQNNFAGVAEIVIEDDTFTCNKNRVAKVCKLLTENNFKLPWTVNTRVSLSYENMVLMKQAGCRLLIAGFESGSDLILKNIKKGTTVAQAIEFMTNARRAKLLVHGCFMVGNPGETSQTLEKTYQLAVKLNPDTAQFFPVMIYPGTESYRLAHADNDVETMDFSKWVTEEGLHSCVITSGDISADKLVAFCNDARLRYYSRPQYILKKGWQSLFDRRELTRNLKGGVKLIKHLVRKS